MLEKNFDQTAEALESRLASEQPLQDTLTALVIGGQQFGSILNTRDDPATSVMTAKGGFPTELDALATWEWEHESQLTELSLSTTWADLGSLFESADLLGV